MQTLIMEQPSITHKNDYFDMLSEWKRAREEIHPGATRLHDNSYEAWLLYLALNRKKETCPDGYVPSDTYFLTKGTTRILGAVSIRHYLNNELLSFGGHIGYGVRPNERRKGYAGFMLDFALEKCTELGLDRALLTCNRENIASVNTILSRGGVYENELPEDSGQIIQRYWINL